MQTRFISLVLMMMMMMMMIMMMNIMVTTAVIMIQNHAHLFNLETVFQTEDPHPRILPACRPTSPTPTPLKNWVVHCICSRPTRLTRRQVMDHSASGTGPKTADRANVTKTAELTPKTCVAGVRQSLVGPDTILSGKRGRRGFV